MPTILDELERLEREATEGPWTSDGSDIRHCAVNAPDDKPTGVGRFYGVSYSDAALIALSRNALPALLRLARAMAESAKTNTLTGLDKSIDPLVYADANAALAELTKDTPCP